MSGNEKVERAMWLKERKCAETDCWNYHEQGYILCVAHLHGNSPRMSDEDIGLVKSLTKTEIGELNELNDNNNC